MKVASLFAALSLLVASSATAATESWSSIVTGSSLELKIIEPTVNGAPANSPLPTIIYLENLAAPRVGTESDDAILKDFSNSGYLVAILDYGHDSRACAPYINRDLGKLRDDLRAKKLLANYHLDDAHIFIVPSGCRLLRDVVF